MRRIIICNYWSCDRWHEENQTQWHNGHLGKDYQIKIAYELCDDHVKDNVQPLSANGNGRKK